MLPSSDRAVIAVPRTMRVAVFLKSLTLTNILSFGPEPHTVELGPLNVIIGPNGSGKSNFIEAIGLLKAAPRDIHEPIREGGGIDEWLWKGGEKEPTGTIEARFTMHQKYTMLYSLSFSSFVGDFLLNREIIDSSAKRSKDLPIVVEHGSVSIAGERDKLESSEVKYDAGRSILSQLRNPFASFDVYYLGERLKSIGIYSEIQAGRSAPARLPQKTDLPNASLARDANNLGLILNRIKRNADARQALKAAIQELYENIDDIDVQIEGGTVQVFVYEGRMAVPATRLSSGTLRFLCLLAILCHPEPPPLICLEEPELGLHPDLIPTISRLLTEASERTQIIVTTHSDTLVDTLTDRPGAVLVAEKGKGGTRLTRLDPEQLKPWLKDYRLGQLWTRGDLGGTRW